MKQLKITFMWIFSVWGLACAGFAFYEWREYCLMLQGFWDKTISYLWPLKLWHILHSQIHIHINRFFVKQSFPPLRSSFTFLHLPQSSGSVRATWQRKAGQGRGSVVGVLQRLSWTRLAMSVAQWVCVCCVTQSCGWIFFPHELSTGFMAHREKEKEGEGKRDQ